MIDLGKLNVLAFLEFGHAAFAVQFDRYAGPMPEKIVSAWNLYALEIVGPLD